jgi:hypothetical protein
MYCNVSADLPTPPEPTIITLWSGVLFALEVRFVMLSYLEKKKTTRRGKLKNNNKIKNK